MDAECGEGATFDTHPWISSADMTSTPTTRGKFTVVEVPLIKIDMPASTLENVERRNRDVMLADNSSSTSFVKAAACAVCGLRHAATTTAAMAILASRGIAVRPIIVKTKSSGSSQGSNDVTTISAKSTLFCGAQQPYGQTCGHVQHRDIATAAVKAVLDVSPCTPTRSRRNAIQAACVAHNPPPRPISLPSKQREK